MSCRTLAFAKRAEGNGDVDAEVYRSLVERLREVSRDPDGSGPSSESGRASPVPPAWTRPLWRVDGDSSADTLERELDWLSALIDERFRSYFGQTTEQPSPELPPPSLADDASRYARFLREAAADANNPGVGPSSPAADPRCLLHQEQAARSTIRRIRWQDQLDPDHVLLSESVLTREILPLGEPSFNAVLAVSPAFMRWILDSSPQ